MILNLSIEGSEEASELQIHHLTDKEYKYAGREP